MLIGTTKILTCLNIGHEIVQCTTDIEYTGFIPSQLMTNTSGCYYSL